MNEVNQTYEKGIQRCSNLQEEVRKHKVEIINMSS